MHLKNLYYLSLITTILTQYSQQDLDKGSKIYQKQQQIRNENKMTYTNVKSYTFAPTRFDDFIIKPSISKQIKFQLNVYWKKQNVYMTAEYKQTQDIRIIIYQDNNRVLLDRQFYITTGFSFYANQGSIYTIRFLSTGNIPKIISMVNSSPLQISQNIATKQNIQGAQYKIQTIDNQLKALFTISNRNYLMKKQLSNKILSKTKIFMGYQIFQIIFIIALSIFQITSITKLLQGGSIV